MTQMITGVSSLAFFINQLDAFDQTLHQPLTDVTWSRDIKLRGGISMANQSTSFVRGAFGGVGTQSASGKAWINSGVNGSLPGVSVNGTPITLPLNLWGREVSYTSVELERSQMMGQNIDMQQMDALRTMYNMDIDEQVYIGDTGLGVYGLLNSAEVTAASATGGAWSGLTADQILVAVNELLTASWAAAGYAVCPDTLLLPPAQFGSISSRKSGTDGAGPSILTYIKQNSISLNLNGRELDIKPVKWLVGRGAGATDRMVAYTNAENRVRFPLVPLRRETPYYKGITFSAPYIALFGAVEFLYPETALYRDGI